MTYQGSDFMGFLPYDLHSDLGFNEAVSAYLRRKHPVHTAKNVARDLGCDVRTAENILAGSLSGKTVTKLIKAYGVIAVVAMIEAVAGQTYEHCIHQEIEGVANERRELDAREERLRRVWEGARKGRSLGHRVRGLDGEAHDGASSQGGRKG